MTDDEFFSSCNENETESDYGDLLTEDEKSQLEVALKIDSSESMPKNGISDGFIAHRHSEEEPLAQGPWCCYESVKHPHGGGNHQHIVHASTVLICYTRAYREYGAMSSLCVEEKVSDLLGDSPPRNRLGRHSVDIAAKGDELRRGMDTRKPSLSSVVVIYKESHCESEYKKGLRPILWLSPNFPLQIEELLPLLDFLANKVKAIRRLRELLTTNLPPGTFPVKVAIPVVPTIRVLVTFTKFEELQPLDEFSTPFKSSSLAMKAQSQLMQLRDLYISIGWPLYRKYGHAYEAFSRHAESQEVSGNEDCPVKMKLVAPPLYALTTQTLDKDVAKRNISKWKCYERMGRNFG
ncbi:hypothetical protein IFM89_023669 [Coptis chinensis]|uniref:Ankyrin repeat domain-containing protein n=1 Tax=Coptis chinensis TaxID=261450 RepID=A0A835HWU8_9MAGN|nr:hypothetical protein IFM89_023669 [Coptis chinensis]